MIPEENLEKINLFYLVNKNCIEQTLRRLFQIQPPTKNEPNEIMERSAEHSLVILKWKRYGKDHSREVNTDFNSNLPDRQKKAQTQQTNSQNDDHSTNNPQNLLQSPEKIQLEKKNKSR